MKDREGERLLERAISIAVEVHTGQTDRFHRPVILHVLRVMMRGQDVEERLLGALHDIQERSDITVEALAGEGFPPQVLKALDHITRREGEDYGHYIDRVAQDDLALRVKLHDLADKLDIRRLKEMEAADLKRFNRHLAAFHRLRKQARTERGGA